MQIISLTVVVAFLCQLVGLVGPGWVVVTSSLLSVKIGIWFAVVCVGESNCETVAMTTYTSTDDVGRCLNITKTWPCNIRRFFFSI